MKISRIRINGIEKPAGFALGDGVEVSFVITDTDSIRAGNIRIEIAGADAPELPVAVKEGADIDFGGEVLKAELKPRTEYRVSIFAKGNTGDMACAESFFETGKMREDWKADWIAAPAEEPCHPCIKKKFSVRPGLKRARLYASAAGLFEAYVNGEKLGDEYLKPGITNYEARLQIITFPVPSLKEGVNELSFLLGKGWYMGIFGLGMTDNNYGDRMAVIGELHLEYEDGTEEIIATDESFQYTASGILESGIYFGETYDGSGREKEWKPVSVITDPGSCEGTRNLVKAHLTDRLSLPVKVKEILPAKEIITTPAGETVVDFGQNFAGFPEFTADFEKGTKIVLDFGEVLQNGNFYRENYREANSQFIYVSNGQKETVRPHFTFFGFRYVRVSGWTGPLTADRFRGCVLWSDLERTGWIRTGNPKIDRLYENTIWGLKSNFIDMPTDCPQRNERLGWTGDAQVFAPTASYHMDTRAFFRKFEQDLMDEQQFLDGAVPNYVPNIGHKKDATSIWGDCGTFLPMVLWRYYGSKKELAFAYPCMKGWVDYMDRTDASRSERSYVFEPGFQFGDWLALDGPCETAFKGGTDERYIGAAYYYQSARLTAEAAGILGKEEDAAYYGALAEKIREGILNEYFTPSGRFALDTQASYVIALKFGLWADRERLVSQFKERLKKDGFRIRCGFAGAPLLCTVLAECGLSRMAYDFLLKEDFPSWLYCVNLGATTVWERWNSIGPDGTISDTGMNSLNHYAYGSVMEFLYAFAAGIRPAAPGFRKAVIAPNPDCRLPKLDCSFDSVSGRYVCNTRIHEDGTVGIHVEVPFGCEAEIVLPGSGKEPEKRTAGVYDFRYEPEKDFRKPFDETTPIARLAENKAALEILFELVPPIGAMARERDPEFGYDGLADFRKNSFLPFTAEALEEAIRRIRDVIVEV